MSQTQTLLNHLEEGHSITSLEALNRFGIARLASRINDLRQAGHEITRVMVPVQNREGNTVYVARYALRGERHE